MGRTVSHTSWSVCPYTLPSTGAYWRSDGIKLLKVFLVLIAEGINFVLDINIYTVYKVLGIKYCLAVELTRLCFSLGPRDSTPPCRTSSLLSRLHPRLDKVEQESQWKIPKNTHTISPQVYHPSASCTSCTLLVAKRWCILRSRVSPGPCHIGIQLPWYACLHQVLQSHLLGQLSCPQSLAKQKRWSLLAS